jgi:hypothetical protein
MLISKLGKEFVIDDVFVRSQLNEMLSEHSGVYYTIYSYRVSVGYHIKIRADLEEDLYYWLMRWGCYAH